MRDGSKLHREEKGWPGLVDSQYPVSYWVTPSLPVNPALVKIIRYLPNGCSYSGLGDVGGKDCIISLNDFMSPIKNDLLWFGIWSSRNPLSFCLPLCPACIMKETPLRPYRVVVEVVVPVDDVDGLLSLLAANFITAPG